MTMECTGGLTNAEAVNLAALLDVRAVFRAGKRV